MNALQKSYRLPTGARTLCVRLRMPHGHVEGEKPKEIQIFADSILKKGTPLAKWIRQGRDRLRVWADFESAAPVQRVELNWTKDLGRWQDRLWKTSPASVENGKASATLPDGARVYYFNLFDARDCVVSTEHQEL